MTDNSLAAMYASALHYQLARDIGHDPNAWAAKPENSDLLRFSTRLSEGGVMPYPPPPGALAGRIVGSIGEEAAENAPLIAGMAWNAMRQPAAPQTPISPVDTGVPWY
jgi:hypothetical protein